jgi:type II secretory pathway component PulM
MKEWWGRIKEWWMARILREKIALGVGGSFLFLFFIYGWVWSPYLNQIVMMRERIVAEQKTLAWMRAADAALSQGASHVNQKPQINSLVMLLSELQKQIQQAKLDNALTEMKQTSQDAMTLRFKNVDFDRWIALLITITERWPVTVAKLSVTATKEPGIVNLEIVIKKQ